MGLFSSQFANVVEWQETRDDVIFWKWNNDEIKKGSRLVIRPGQDAIFMYNGKVEGIFESEGSFDIESEIIPFLSSLKGIKFGFNSGIRTEVLFINTKEITVKWGTKNVISIPAPNLPGGMPIRAFGTFTCAVTDRDALIDKVAGIKQMYTVDDVKERVLAILDQLLMKWISREGKDMFNLQANAYDIAKGIREELDMEIYKIGISITGFNIQSFSYPSEVEAMQRKVASQQMIGDMNRYQQVSMIDSMNRPGGNSGGNMATQMAGMQVGMMMGQQMVDQMKGASVITPQTSLPVVQQPYQQQTYSSPQVQGNGVAPRFCPNCGQPTNGANFCGNCGNKLV
ncbi:MAG: SPFH domain-containing protein [Lachnospiraceae bacterium]|nr:SPFH domain-containing protein [Lachnospiraceae bacterium]